MCGVRSQIAHEEVLDECGAHSHMAGEQAAAAAAAAGVSCADGMCSAESAIPLLASLYYVGACLHVSQER